MKFLTATLVISLTTFTLSTMMSESLFPRNGTLTAANSPEIDNTTSANPQSRVAAKSSGTRTNRRDNSSVPATIAKSSSTPSASNSTATASLTSDMREQLRELREREAAVKAQQEMMKLIYDEIQTAQGSVDNLRQQTMTEIADAARNTKLSKPPRGQKTASKSGASRPTLSMSNAQSANDAAVLVRRLAQEGSIVAAASLLNGLKERDAAKVLAILTESDPQLATKLTDNLRLARSADSRRQ